MKKLLLYAFAILLVTQLNFVKNQRCGDKNDPSGVDDCKNLALDTGDVKCCYWEAEWDGGSDSVCSGITQEQYDNIDDYIDSEEEDSEKDGYSDFELSIDCSSNYLVISLLYLLLLILWKNWYNVII